MTIKPQLACDFDEEKLTFPLYAQPKIDGVRAINLAGWLTGRSLKAHKNKHTTARFSGVSYIGFDGELAIKGQKTSPTLCRDTTSAVNRIEGFPALDWNLFDLILPETIDLPYDERYVRLEERVMDLGHSDVNIVPYTVIHNLEELLIFENKCLDDGYEGVILRDPHGLHKSGRATVRGGSYLRIKRFIDFEGIVVGITEAKENQNEAKVNELGHTERSTHQANMVPKGMVGTIQMELLADVVYRDKVLFTKGQVVDVGPGNMPHDERVAVWKDPSRIMRKIGKGKLFPHGTKDKPRFPTWVSLRAEEDMSE